MTNKIYTTENLQLRIAELEALSLQQEARLKITASGLREDLKPANLIKDVFKSTVLAPGSGKSLLKGAFGLAAGFLSKKIFVMGSSSIVRKTLGTVVELGVAKVVANNAGKIAAGSVKWLNKTRK